VTFSSVVVITCLHYRFSKADVICMIHVVWWSITDESLAVCSGIFESRHCLYCCWNETRSWKGKLDSSMMTSYYLLYCW